MFRERDFLRHVRFNVNELARRAADVVSAKTYMNVAKYPDSMYNKSMLLIINNRSRVVVKVPNPNAGLPHWITASEVATMDFALRILEIPIPKVLAWCFQAHEDPVGSEYIMMEDKVWTSVAFTRYGSLYSSRDLEDTRSSQPLYIDANGGNTADKRFAIDPQGDSLKVYHRAIGQHEIACINQLSELPKSPITLCGPGIYQLTKGKKVKALHCYLDLIKQRLPEDQTISKAANTLYLQQPLCSLYHTLIDHRISRLYAALRFQHTGKYSLLLLARNLLIDGEALYLGKITELEQTWDEFSGKEDSNYLFAFSNKEREELKADAEGATRGIVKADDYEEVLDALSQMKDQMISAFVTNARGRQAWEKAWPFGN
ncbi:hypothetical protein COCVIDRAFT_38092 [Bipolaris victoriae FI3]|uniref:Aminoglycoside phosphotransferase domain-containing protein n=1 Tax=Bipolaris victoriae (strain FI3) TaxID=930091 RepID=W7EL49_BIPV3|nr:hypothetical protein COCVIDRAFT_38092 [Bipolaris victoriae FI3]